MSNDAYGATCAGNRYVGMVFGDQGTWLAQKDVTTIERLSAALRTRGIMPGSPADLKATLEAIRNVREFPPVDVAGQSGWHGEPSIYFHADGASAVPKGATAPQMAFARSSIASAGNPIRWKREVAALLEQWPTAKFALALMFLGPLLRLMPSVQNATVEFVGGQGSGKTVLRNVMASASGGTGVNGSPQYWHSIDSVIDKLSEVILDHRDRTLILDGTHLLGHVFDAKKLARPYLTLAHNAGRGDLAIPGTPSGTGRYRGVVTLFGRESLRTVAGKGDPSQDEMLTLTIPIDWGVPPEHVDKPAFLEALMTSAASHYGHAHRRFIKALVARLGRNREAFIRKLDKWQAEFLTKAGVDRGLGRDYAKAKVFAAAYAAAKLAQELKVLPGTLTFGKALTACYTAFRAQNTPRISFADRLEALAGDDRILKVSGQKDDRQSQRALQALGTLVSLPTHRELRVPPANIGRVFDDWKAIWKTDEVRGFMVPADGRGLKPKVSLARGLPAKRCWCFTLPLQEQGLFDADPGAEGSE
ncbi:hypothetical protein ASE00_16260 [Sphingomonas sp. Root710]|uniref:DUF927 domain-containing protein n=1 Tax=Sphingomonas sp. Root710 TaxID=1736594 RepID=UPI0006FB2566|nr:DUF927 domain-containing protein [Sphingomonas sp. Root710]KRB80600.1 hypothetical protein ASE00_16260 [Sphingomonas sp. Root710]